MIFLIFAALFIVGGVAALVLMRLSYEKAEAVVCESNEKLSARENEITRLMIRHAIELKKDPGNIIITDVIPVHEPDGATVKVRIDKKTGQPVKNTLSSFIVIPFAMFVAGLFSLVLWLLDSNIIPKDFFENKISLPFVITAALFVLFLCLLLSDLVRLLNPNIVKVKGRYEGFMHSGADHKLNGFYGLWYGEHKQYAKGRVPIIESKPKDRTLYFNTKKGTVIKKADIVMNVCLCIIFAAGAVVLYKFL